MSINYGSNSVATSNKITSAAIDITDGYNTLYYYSGGDYNWTTAANWYLDYDHTIPAGRIPTINDIAVILNPVTSSSGSIEAKEIIVKDNGYLGYATDIYSDVKFFDSTYISAGSITGNASFYDGSYINAGGSVSSPVVVGHTNFYNTSYIGINVQSYFGLSVTFNDDSHPYSSTSVYCQEININGSDICTASYYGNVNITSGYSISIGSTADFTIYDGILTIYKNNIINGNYVKLYNSSLILKDSSYLGPNNTLNFYGICKFIIDNTASTTHVSGCTINSSSYGNYNANLTIVVNGYVNSTYGWMFGGASNSITCNKLIFNGNTFYYGGNYLYIFDSIIFNDQSYWSSSATNSANNSIPKLIFNDDSYNDGIINCNLAIFNDYSYNDGTIGESYDGNGSAIFNDYSENHSSCAVDGLAIFKDFSQNYGSLGSDAWFDGFSSHNGGGSVYGIAYYLGPFSDGGGSAGNEYFQNWDYIV